MVKTQTKLQESGRQYLEKVLTRHRGSQSDEGDGIDAILEIDEATKMTGDVSNDGSTETNGSDGDDEGGVSVEDSCLKYQRT